MPKDAGGLPYPEGGDHGGSDDEFDAVVLDESFVRAAQVHEPTAEERILAAVEARLERETAAGTSRGRKPGDPNDETDSGEAGDAGDLDDIDEAYDVEAAGEAGRRSDRSAVDADGPPFELRQLGSGGRYRVGHWYGGGPGGYQHNWTGHGGRARWQHGVAWVLALLMGVGVVLIAAAAVYRGVNSGGTRPMVPVQSSSPESNHGSSADGGTARTGGGGTAGTGSPGASAGATTVQSPAPSVKAH